MIVVIGNDIPPAVRGRMKLWFVEIKPNIFVSGVKDIVARRVVDFLLKNCPLSSGLVIIEETNKAPYYKITQKGNSLKNVKELGGLMLFYEKVTGFDNE